MSHFKVSKESGGPRRELVLIADNGEPVAIGTERYRDEHDAKRGASDLVAAAVAAIEFDEPVPGGIVKLSGDLAVHEAALRFVVEEDEER